MGVGRNVIHTTASIYIFKSTRPSNCKINNQMFMKYKKGLPMVCEILFLIFFINEIDHQFLIYPMILLYVDG